MNAVCPRCHSTQTFNRHTHMLCLSCGYQYGREKLGKSVTDLQLANKALQAQVDRLTRENEILRVAIARIKALPIAFYNDADATFNIVAETIKIIKELGETPPEKDQT